MTDPRGLTGRSLPPGRVVPRRWAAITLMVVALLAAGAAPPASATPVVRALTSPAGIPVWLVANPGAALVTLRFAFLGGAVEDPSGKQGLTAVMLDLLDEGAGTLDGPAYKARRETLATRIDVSARKDVVTGGMASLARHLDASAELLRLALASPRLGQDALARVVTQQTAGLGFAASDPRLLAREAWHAEAFPDHPYGRPERGTAASLAAITRDDVVARHRDQIARDRLRVVLVGDFDQASAGALVDQVFAGLPAKSPSPLLTVSPPRAPATAGGPVTVTTPGDRAVAVLGRAGLPTRHRDYAAALVINHILGGGGLDARLAAEVRVKRGLAYAAETEHVSDQAGALLLGELSTDAAQMDRALGVVREVLGQFAAEGPTAAELESAQGYLVGAFLLGFDTSAKIAANLLEIWLAGGEPDALVQRNAAIAAVTLADARRVAADLLSPASILIAVAGGAK